jgi:YgiT-type zinc finger domain-containing protein
MKCSIEGCPGQYEERQIVHTIRRQGQVIVIDRVPAEVCSGCGFEVRFSNGWAMVGASTVHTQVV